MKNTFITAGLFLCIAFAAVHVPQAQAPCPPCYHNKPPMTGHGQARNLPPQSNCDCATADCRGCPGDNRRVIITPRPQHLTKSEYRDVS